MYFTPLDLHLDLGLLQYIDSCLSPPLSWNCYLMLYVILFA